MDTRKTRYYELAEIIGEHSQVNEIDSTYDYIEIASKGLNAHVIHDFRKHFKLSREDTSSLLNISEPTMYRWIKNNKPLGRNYAIQLLELSDLFLFGIEVFEDSHSFFTWLELPNTALAGLQPIKLLEVPQGIAKVRELLGRIQHGVYS